MLQDTWHKVEISLGYGELNPIIKWAENNCTNNWNYEIIVSAGKEAGLYRFFFKEDRDAVAFTIWKT